LVELVVDPVRILVTGHDEHAVDLVVDDHGSVGGFRARAVAKRLLGRHRGQRGRCGRETDEQEKRTPKDCSDGPPGDEGRALAGAGEKTVHRPTPFFVANPAARVRGCRAGGRRFVRRWPGISNESDRRSAGPPAARYAAARLPGRRRPAGEQTSSRGTG